MGEDVKLISSGKEAANAAYAMLTKANLLTEKQTPGTSRYYVSDSTEQFMENAHSYLGEDLNARHSIVELVNIED
jgi:glutamate racemase